MILKLKYESLDRGENTLNSFHQDVRKIFCFISKQSHRLFWSQMKMLNWGQNHQLKKGIRFTNLTIFRYGIDIDVIYIDDCFTLILFFDIKLLELLQNLINKLPVPIHYFVLDFGFDFDIDFLELGSRLGFILHYVVPVCDSVCSWVRLHDL